MPVRHPCQVFPPSRLRKGPMHDPIQSSCGREGWKVGVAISYEGNPSPGFHVSPASCVATLAQMWDSAVSVKAVRTLSRAVTLTPLTVTAFEADAQQGIISLTVACDALGEQFFEQGEPASAALFISDGNNSIISDYIELVVQ